jgi:hypothetical protein
MGGVFSAAFELLCGNCSLRSVATLSEVFTLLEYTTWPKLSAIRVRCVTLGGTISYSHFGPM